VTLHCHGNIKFHILPNFKLLPKPFSPHLNVILMFQQQHLSDNQVTTTVLRQIERGEVGSHRSVCWTFASLTFSIRHLNAIKPTASRSFLGIKPLPALQQM
jgi:hypothetical protein